MGNGNWELGMGAGFFSFPIKSFHIIMHHAIPYQNPGKNGPGAGETEQRKNRYIIVRGEVLGY